MIDISSWSKLFCKQLSECFGDRVWFVGLQGSYSRGEATESSDLDMVVILDELQPADISKYHAMLDSLPNRELLCGFLSGKAEMLNWEPSDLFQFYYDTTPIKGSLDELLPFLDNSAVNRAIQTGVCNIYHGCVHNMLYEESNDILYGLYKSAVFVVQAIVFIQTGRYFRKQEELCAAAPPQEQAIVHTFRHLRDGGEIDFAKMSEALFTWAKNRITE